jgi:hypothetical protein
VGRTAGHRVWAHVFDSVAVWANSLPLMRRGIGFAGWLLIGAAYAEMRALSSDEVGNAFRVELAEWLETQERTNRGLMYRMFGGDRRPA